MKVNKKALYALAAYYESCDNRMHPTESDLNLLMDMFITTIKDSFDMEVLRQTFHHLEKFFKVRSNASAYAEYICDREIAKFLRYVACYEKFPPFKRLHYVQS